MRARHPESRASNIDIPQHMMRAPPHINLCNVWFVYFFLAISQFFDIPFLGLRDFAIVFFSRLNGKIFLIFFIDFKFK